MEWEAYGMGGLYYCGVENINWRYDINILNIYFTYQQQATLVAPL